jgi:hypothetical protein
VLVVSRALVVARRTIRSPAALRRRLARRAQRELLLFPDHVRVGAAVDGLRVAAPAAVPPRARVLVIGLVRVGGQPRRVRGARSAVSGAPVTRTGDVTRTGGATWLAGASLLAGASGAGRIWRARGVRVARGIWAGSGGSSVPRAGRDTVSGLAACRAGVTRGTRSVRFGIVRRYRAARRVDGAGGEHPLAAG